MTVREIYDAIDRIAPFQTAMDFDNVGILVGDENVEVTKTLLCLDVTPRVLREAKSIGVELIISHHLTITPYFKVAFIGIYNYIVIFISTEHLCYHTTK